MTFPEQLITDFSSKRCITPGKQRRVNRVLIWNSYFNKLCPRVVHQFD